jgi:arylsulfatase A-like enzyme
MGSWTRLKDNLALFALLQIPWLLLNILLSKAMAARYAYPSAPPGTFIALFFRTLAFDLLTLCVLAVLILLSSRSRGPRRFRGAALSCIYLGFCSLGALYYIDAGAFMRFGAPLSRDVLALVLPLVGHSSKVIAFDDPLLQLAAAGFVWPAVLTLVVWPEERRLANGRASWTPQAWVLTSCLVVITGLAFILPTNAQRERTLRRIAPIALLLPRIVTTPEPSQVLTPGHERVLRSLLGETRIDGSKAFAGLRRGKRNVVIWVWESVGERFLESHHPLGHAHSPQLDRLEARGGVRFSRAYVDCPLSAQSTFTLMTATAPPANPGVFRKGWPLPRKAPYLPALFKAGGYRTAFLNSSYLDLWGEIGFLREAGLDVVEDANSLPNRSRFRYQQWSIEGRALVDRFFDWQGRLSPSEPFFAVIWNVEGHVNYGWIGMPKELEKDPAITRYERSIEYSDRLLGEFFDGLVARGLDGDTLVVVVGDHGQGLGRGDQPYDRFESLLVREDAIHVPLVFLHPDLPRGTSVVDTAVGLADVYPTVLDLVGLPVPEGSDGASLARPYQPRVMVSRAMTWWPLSARAGRFKLVVDYPGDPPELYDIPADPWEIADVSARHPDVTDALWTHLVVETARREREDRSFALLSSDLWKRF